MFPIRYSWSGWKGWCDDPCVLRLIYSLSECTVRAALEKGAPPGLRWELCASPSFSVMRQLCGGSSLKYRCLNITTSLLETGLGLQTGFDSFSLIKTPCNGCLLHWGASEWVMHKGEFPDIARLPLCVLTCVTLKWALPIRIKNICQKIEMAGCLKCGRWGMDIHRNPRKQEAKLHHFVQGTYTLIGLLFC